MTPRIVPTVAAVVCLAVACSSGDDAGSATTVRPTAASSTSTEPATTSTSTVPPTTTPPPTAPPTTAPPATTAPPTSDPADDGPTASELADQELARSALITIDVFPDGWVEDPLEDDDDDPRSETFEAEFDRCLGRDDDARIGDELEDLTVGTGDFHPADADTTTVSHEVVLAADEATAVTAMSEVAIDGAETCLADVIEAFYIATFADDPDLAEIAVGDVIVTRTETDLDPSLAVGVMLEVPLTIGDEAVSQFLEILYQRSGRALSELSFSSFGGPFDRDGYAILGDEAMTRIDAVGS